MIKFSRTTRQWFKTHQSFYPTSFTITSQIPGARLGLLSAAGIHLRLRVHRDSVLPLGIHLIQLHLPSAQFLWLIFLLVCWCAILYAFHISFFDVLIDFLHFLLICVDTLLVIRSWLQSLDDRSLQHKLSTFQLLDCLPPFSELGFPDISAGKDSACNAGDLGPIPGLGRSPGERKGYPLLYSGLENSMDCIAHGVAKSQTQLSDFHFSLNWL